MASLELSEVSFTYPDSDVPILTDINFKLSRGDFCYLYGRNGSGKSTLARIMAGVLKPTKGYVKFNGQVGTEDWNGVGLLMQDPQSQIMTFNVEREIAWGLENLGLARETIVERVNWALELFDLVKFRYSDLDSLSDGQRQVVVLASIVAMRPAFLILDEATAYLDDIWTKRILNFMQEYKNEAGILWITSRINHIIAFPFYHLDGGKMFIHSKDGG